MPLNLSIKNNLTVVMVLFCAGLSAQVTPPTAYDVSTKINYVREWDAMAPETSSSNLITRPLKDVRQSTQYIDGLGRPIQMVIKQGSLASGGTATDMVTAIVYDQFGREEFKYLPFVSNTTGGNTSLTDGMFKLNPFQQQAAFYATQLNGQSQTFYYGRTKFEASPVGRTEKMTAPGNNWVGNNKGVEIKYYVNTSTDSVRIWNVTNVSGSFGTYASPASYQAGELFKTISIDEHGNQVVEFKDKDEKVILKKVQLTADADDGSGEGYFNWLCSYYIYDDLKNLRCVVQPEGVKLLIENAWDFTALTGDILNEQCFRYEYDERDRMIIKKVPGAGETWMVYDKWDRMVLTQDANLRSDNKWMFTKYDQVNRPIYTGFYVNTTYTTQNAMQGYLTSQNLGRYETYNVSNWPLYSLTNSFPSISFNDVITITYYDDYSWVGWYGVSPTVSNLHDEFYLTGSSFPYPETPVQSTKTRNLPTGIWQKNGSLKISYYDDESRLIQTGFYNQTGGWDITGYQYSWNGQPLITSSRTIKAGTNAQTTDLVTKISYDSLWRPVKTEKRIRSTLVNGNAMTDYKTIAEQEYDALGQLKKKKLAPAYNSGSGLESLAYEYNIRGWLKSINKAYLSASPSDSYFGMELGYDNYETVSGTTNFLKRQYNGNISGTIWRTKGDGISRKLDFDYDNANRFNRADYLQNTSGSTWENSSMDYSVWGFDADNGYKMKFDGNGNILSMIQSGWKVSSSGIIDALRYEYLPNSNKLKRVSDDLNDETTKLGDFHYEAASKTATDYAYDSNGNLVEDKNKKISSITYNHLNLPAVITVMDKGTITYYYDMLGNKLKKTVAETNQPTKTTLYLGGLVFENDTLQLAPHEEGRTRFTPANGATAAKFDYDYFVKDHLGNVRMVLTEEQQQDVYVAATLEGSINTATDALYIEKDYYSIDAGKIVSNPSGMTNDPNYPNNEYRNHNGQPPYNPNPNSVTANYSQKVYELKATSGGGVTGLGITLKVMSGDQISIFGKSYYSQINSGSTNYDVPVLSILDGFVGAPSSLAGSKGATGSGLNSITAIANAVNDFLDDPARGSGTTPKAYINWVFFDEQFRYAGGGFDRAGSNNIVKHHNTGLVSVPKNGYVYIYVSNESPVSVFFDNLQVIHNRGPILEETHYYPFGLTMAGISGKAHGKLENDKKYNGIEFDKSLSIDIYDAELRELDPQIGRWWQVDPEIENMERWSPYASNYDNPILFSDPLGDEPEINEQNEMEGCCEFLRKGLIAAGGVLNGGLNIVTGGLWSTAPAGTSNYTQEDLDLYESSVRMGQLAALIPLIRTGITPKLAPVQGAPIEIPVVSPLMPPGTTERTNSTSTSTAPGATPTSKTPTNGNSKKSENTQHGYEIRDIKTKELHKNGVSGQKLNKNGSSPRAIKQVNQLNKATNSNKYKSNVVKKNVTGKNGKTARENILNWESGSTRGYRLRKGQNPPGNVKPN